MSDIVFLYILTFGVILVLGYKLYKINEDIAFLMQQLNDTNTLLIEIYKKLNINSK